ncbi:MAG: DUF1232 domain-containing protein [Bacilli bacterium]|nr:DUF1232 domain-containing protein [Bacilli bacterium]
MLQDSKKTEDFLDDVEAKFNDVIENKIGIDKTEQDLQRLEEKLKLVPKIGDSLSVVPAWISLARSYVKKEYTDIPLGSVVAIVGSLVYFFSPVDLIPDAVPIAGYIDDAFVIDACFKLVKSDVDEYIKWRKDNNKVLQK